MKSALLAALLVLSVLSHLHAEEIPLVIGKITVSRRNVFDTGAALDKKFPYSWANAIHIVTKERYIRRETLFKEGDPFDWDVIRESERLLRSRPIFRYVTIVPEAPLNGVVDIRIETEDVWSTTVRLAYGTAGGKNFYKLGFLEHNFLGQGRSIGAFIRRDIDRTVRGMATKDPRFLGTRWELSAGYGRDEKGVERQLDLERPYYSVLTTHSEGVFIRSVDDEDRLFQNGDEIANFQHETRDLRAAISYSIDPQRSRVHRVSLAYLWNEDAFFDLHSALLTALPEDRKVSAAAAGYEFQRVNFIKERGVVTFDRDEDINLGWEGFVEGGPSLKKWGATRDGAVHRLDLSKAWKPFSNQIWFTQFNSDGRFEDERLANTIAKFRAQFYFLDWWRANTALVRLTYEVGKNLDAENQFTLGGENGLRGYSVRQFSGNKKAVAVFENRRPILYDWLHLVSFGWAVFADTGGVWEANEEPSFDDFNSDVGVVIRLAPSRSLDPTLIRIDLAYALNDNDRSSRFVFNIGGEVRFGERPRKKFEQ